MSRSVKCMPPFALLLWWLGCKWLGIVRSSQINQRKVGQYEETFTCCWPLLDSLSIFIVILQAQLREAWRMEFNQLWPTVFQLPLDDHNMSFTSVSLLGDSAGVQRCWGAVLPACLDEWNHSMLGSAPATSIVPRALSHSISDQKQPASIRSACVLFQLHLCKFCAFFCFV